jgi:hypothetical protein
MRPTVFTGIKSELKRPFLLQNPDRKTKVIFLFFLVFGWSTFNAKQAYSQDTTEILQLIYSSNQVKETNPALSWKLANKAKKAALEVLDPKFIGYAYVQLGNLLEGRGKYQLSRQNYDTALWQFISKPYKPEICGLWSSYGILAKKQDLKKEAVYCFSNALKMADTLQDKTLQAMVFLNFGEFYRKNGEPSKAWPLLKSSLKLYQNMKRREMESEVLNQMAQTYEETHPLDAVEKVYQQSLSISESLKDSAGMGKTLDLLGTYYFNNEDNKKAQECFIKAWISVRNLTYETQAKSTIANHLAASLVKSGNCMEARPWAEKGLAFGETVGLNEEIIEAYKNLSTANECLQDFKGALFFRKKQANLEKELLQNTIRNRAVEWETRFQQTLKGDSVLNHDRKSAITYYSLNFDKAEKRLKQTNLLLFGALLGAIGIWGWWFEKNRKLKKDLEKQKNDLSQEPKSL